MLIPVIKCDLCGERIEGSQDQHAYSIRKKATDAGWKQGHAYGSNGGLVFIEHSVRMDFCPACVRKEYERRALRPQTA